MRLNSVKIETDGCDEIACNDTCTLTLDLTRTHAKTFTDKKVELCQKQGLNVQEQVRAVASREERAPELR